MITLKEYLGIEDINFINVVTQQNIDILLDKLNKFRQAYGRPMIVTSGFRSIATHKRIYKSKGVPDAKIPMGSKHLSGQACDFSDVDGSLKEWVKQNEDLVLNSFQLWAEHYKATPTWLHLQSVPYGSYKKGKSIWFIP